MKDFKNTKWVDSNHMKFESGYKTFDKQVDYISAGNVISNVQHSSQIRRYSDTNGGVCEPGRCRKDDIYVMSVRSIPAIIMNWLTEHPEEKVWLYNFHFQNKKRKVGDTIGWVMTNYDHTKVILSVCCFGWGTSRTKRSATLDEAIKYIVKGNWS